MEHFQILSIRQNCFYYTPPFSYSRHSYIADYSQGGTLEDGSPCWKDFSNSRNNRFMTAEGTSKNRIVSPGKVLHFYNAPPDISNDQLNEVSQNTFFFFCKIYCGVYGRL